MIAGAVAAIFGGSRLQVSGPTGAMTVVLVPLVAAHGASVIYPIAILAGVLLMLAGLLRLGPFVGLHPLAAHTKLPKCVVIKHPSGRCVCAGQMCMRVRAS